MKKTRVSVTMTKPYVEALDRLVEEGVYLKRGEAILEGLRILFKQRVIEPSLPMGSLKNLSKHIGEQPEAT